jgi:autotransporter-associated beta strand protein
VKHLGHGSSRCSIAHDRRRLTALVALTTVHLLLGLHPVNATDKIWTGGTSTQWNSNGNWTGNAPAAGDNAKFNGTFTNQPNLTGNASVGGIWMTSGIGQNVTISGGSNILTLQANTINGTGGLGILIDSPNSFTLTISTAVKIGNAQTWRNNSGNLFSVSGTLDLNNKGLTVDGTANTTISGSISGAGGFTKSGSGTAILSNTGNSFTGTITANGGDLQLSTFTLATGTTASIASGATFTSTGTLNLTADTSAAQTFVSGSGTLRLANSSSSSSTPDIFYDATNGTGSGYAVTIASNMDVGSGTRYLNGLSNRNDYERYGGDLVFSGSLTGSAALNFLGTPNTGGANPPYQMAYTLGGNNTSFTGDITLSAGAELIVDNASALTAANSVTFNPGAGSVSAFYLYGTSVTIGALSGTSAGSMYIRNGSLVSDSNATINPGIIRSNATLTVQQSTNTTFNGIISDGPNDRGTGDSGSYYTLAFTKAGNGTLTLGGTNTYTGITTVNSGTLQFAKQVALYNNSPASWTASNIVVASGATAAFNVGGTGEFTSANIDTLKALGTATGGFKSGSSLGLDTSNVAGGIFTYASNIANPNGGTNVLGLTKLGTATLTLTGANTYTGGTTLNAGTLQLSGSGTLGATSGSLNVNGGTLDLNGTNQTVGALGGSGGTIGNNATGTAKTLTVGQGGGTGAYAGIITDHTSGTGTTALTKAGSGTETLTGANTFTGATTINGGTLTLAATGGTRALGSTIGVTINSGGTLLLGANDQIKTSATVTMAGGTLSKGNFSEGASNSVGMGALTLTASGSHLDFGTGTVGVLSFASLTASTFTITIDNWTGTYAQQGSAGADRLIFDSDQSANLNAFYFTGYGSGAVEYNLGGGFFEVVAAVPEPATYVPAAAALALLGAAPVRRFIRRPGAGVRL